MNLYHCSIDLKDGAKALSFAMAVDQWLSHLQERGVIQSWRMMRRKLNLASDRCRDFLIEIEVENLTQLDAAFRLIGEDDFDAERLHNSVNQMIAAADFGLYRPFPDAARAERMAIF